MTGITFHTDTIEILTPATNVDRYGNASQDWDAATVTPVPKCRLVPEVGTEAADRVTRRWVLFAPVGTPLTAADRVRWRDVIYDVTGEVRVWASPSGALAHIEADLSRVEG